jgi:uncharacterized membrane protein
MGIGSQATEAPVNDRHSAPVPGQPRRGPGALAHAGPFACLAASALWLLRHWEDLPRNLPMHWNARFEPDSFAPRTPLSATLPLVIGLLVCLLLLAMQAGVKRSAPDSALRAWTLKTLLVGEYFSVLVCCGVVAATATNGRLLKPVLFFSLIGVLALLIYVSFTARGIPRDPARNPAAWRGGFFYVDRDDPALFVPKRSGLGYTFNYGHPAALPLTLVTLVVPLAIAAAVLLLR